MRQLPPCDIPPWREPRPQKKTGTKPSSRMGVLELRVQNTLSTLLEKGKAVTKNFEMISGVGATREDLMYKIDLRSHILARTSHAHHEGHTLE